MISAAIIVSVSRYSSELRPLPACDRDSEAIEAIIFSESRFDKKLVVRDEHNSVEVNEKIFDFLHSLEDQSVDELFCYFTGHGESVDDDFLYLLRDYKSSQRRSTSILNSRLDDAVRRVKPKVFVKFVDACESGVSYIKNSIDAEKFQKTKAGFNDVFFLYSSSSSEASYADNHLSFLTESVIKSIIDHKADKIKYANILNYTSDFFENLDFQRPYVVQQGNINNVFCASDEAAKFRLFPFLRSSQSSPATDDKQPQTKSRLDVIKEDSSNYCSKEEAEAAIFRCGDFLKDIELPGDLKEIFSTYWEQIPIDSLPPAADIGSYLNKIGGKSYFAKATYRDAEPDEHARRMSSMGLSSILMPPAKRIVSGFEHTTKMSVPCYRIIASSKYAAVNEIRCFVAPIVSRMNILLAHRIYQYERSDWDRIKIASATEWRFEEAAIKADDEINSALERIRTSFNEYVETYIAARFGHDLI